MNEATVRAEVQHMLRYTYQLWPDHWPDIPGTKQPGRPDIVVMSPTGPGFYIEAKVLYLNRSKSLKFNCIPLGQRRWLSKWEEVRRNGSHLAIGTVNCPKRGVWLIPWPKWLEVERAVEQHAAYLPYEAGPGTLRVLQQQHYDFGLFAEYKLLGTPTKGWVMPPKMEKAWKLPPRVML